MLYYGFDQYGTRVVQKLIEKLALDSNSDLFLRYLLPNMIALFKDINGNHIIIKYTATMNSFFKQPIYDMLNKNLVEISTDKHGCCAIQKCIDNAEEKERVV
jgi:cell wall assembly regulator SMI1